MAHIRPRVGKSGVVYQANIRRSGKPHQARTFPTLEAAQAWAELAERSIDEAPTQEIHPIPKRHGVYIIWGGKKCLYVGSSMANVMERISKHCGTMATHYSIVECRPEDILATEYRLIAELQPINNSHGTLKQWRRARGSSRG